MADDALRRFLVELATTPAALGAFRADPAQVAGRRLADADVSLLLGGDAGALHARLSGSSGTENGWEPGSRSANVAPADLTIVGSGIRAVGQFTIEALAAVLLAGKVWHLVADQVGAAVIEALNPNAESLSRCYVEGKLRHLIYEDMTERILQSVRSGTRTCAVFYGHPGVFVYPSKLAVDAARAEGYSAELLPGVSAEDSLYADLGIDPGTTGVQAYEATDFLMHERTLERSAGLILWQVGVVGAWDHRTTGVRRCALGALVDKLLRFYPADHAVVLYEAAIYPAGEARTAPIPLASVGDAPTSPATTLYVPALHPPAVDRAWWAHQRDSKIT